jgi:ABC-2 type transport system permease protein
VSGAFTPAPGRAPARRIFARQARMELILTARRGEAAVLALGVPFLVLLGAGLTDATTLPVTTDRLGYVVPGVLALTVLSTAFTGQAITTGYERGHGVLKRLGASPLTRAGLLGAKSAAVLGLVLIQTAVLGTVGAAVGWRPQAGQVAAAAGVTVLAVVAYSGLALMLASLLKPETVTATATLVYVVMLAGGGIMFAAPDLGGAERFLLPLSAHAEALRATLTDGRPVGTAAWLSLLAWAAVAVIGARRVIRWE